jgi:hypothetical protein
MIIIYSVFSIGGNGLAKFRGRFKRAIFSIRPISKPSKIVYILNKPFIWLAGVS